ncbi:MAG: TonB-dependent receptor plug domain-containing protein [Sphingomonadaceae bacterium]
MNISKSAVAAVLAATSVPAFAESEMADDSSTIIVTGVLADDDTPINPVRLPQSARISSQTLDEEDVEKRQARDVYDLLNYGTGIFTTTTGTKAPSNLNIRGDGNFAFIIDGAYVPRQLSARILQTIPADAIEEVRIVRTSTALTVNPLVGIISPSGAANNGFIVVRTKRPRKTEATVRLMGGSFDTIGASARVGTTFGGDRLNGYVQAMGATYNTDGPDGFNLDKRYQFAGLKGGMDIGVVALDLSVMKSWSRYGIVHADEKLRPMKQDDDWRLDPINSLVATANGTIRWNSQNTTLLTAAYTDSKGKFITADQQPDGSLANRLVRDNNNSFFNLAARHNLFLGDTKFQAGMDYIHWKNPSGQYYYEGIPREEKVTGYFLQADQALFDGKLNIDVAGRIDKVKIVQGIDYYQPGRGPSPDVRVIRNENLPSAKFFSAGASLRLGGDWMINGRYGYSSQGARRGVVLADPSTPLKGEKRSKFEAGIEGRLTDWLRPTANFFYIKTNNEVQPVAYDIVGGEQVGLYGNTDSKRTGVEAIVQGRWGGDGPHDGGYRASITHYFDVLDPSGLLARSQPDTVAEFTFDQSYNQWRLSGAAKYVAQYESNAFTACAAPNRNCFGGIQGPYLPIGDFVNIDFALGYQIPGDVPLRITASVKNLLDDNYQTTVGFPSIGRQFGLELFAAF